MTSYREPAQPADKGPLDARAPRLLRLSGEVPADEDVQVRKVRGRRVLTARVDLVLRSGDGAFDRTLSLTDAPAVIRAAIEQRPEPGAPAREVAPADLPKTLRARLRREVAEQAALGYDVDVARVTLAEEEVAFVRYRRERRAPVDVWLGTSPPAVLAYEEGKGNQGIGALVPRPFHERPRREQIAIGASIVLGFLYLASRLLIRTYF